MKCPKCGFVSFPGLHQCKKCGYRLPAKITRPDADFISESPQALVSSTKQVKYPLHAKESRQTEQPLRSPGPILYVPEADQLIETRPPIQPPTPISPPAAGAPAADPSEGNWREEIAARVEDFRRRRGGPEEEKGKSLKFDFDFAAPAAQESAHESAEPPSAWPPFGADFEANAPTPLAKPSAELDPAAMGGAPLESAEETAGRSEVDPLEIELGSREDASAQETKAGGALPNPVAPLRDRLLAGLGDVLILLIAAGVFALIFAPFHSTLKPSALNLAVFLFMGALMSLIYFGVFVAMAYATPGMLWMGLEVRAFDGSPPGLREAIWRAIGCLISAAALLLGFVWAAVDPERLTWHDRISRTFITEAQWAFKPGAADPVEEDF